MSFTGKNKVISNNFGSRISLYKVQFNLNLLSIVMKNFQELTSLIYSLQTIQKIQPPNFPCFSLVSSSSVLKSCFSSSILGFSILPSNFSHKLRHLEIIFETSRKNIGKEGYFYEIKGVKEEFTSFQKFQEKLCHQISSLPKQNYSETVTVKISSKNLPYMTILDIPELLFGHSQDLDEEMINLEITRKKAIKHAIQDPNNLIICLIDEEEDPVQTKPLNYLRKYDPNGLRSLVVFIGSEISCQKAHEIEKIISEGGFVPKHGFLFMNSASFRKNMHKNSLEIQINFEEKHLENENSMYQKDNQDIWEKMKEIVQYSIRTIFPGLLDELHWIDKDLQTQLVEMRKEAEKQGFDPTTEGDENVENYENKFCLEFQVELSKYKTFRSSSRVWENENFSKKPTRLVRRGSISVVEDINSVRRQSGNSASNIGSNGSIVDVTTHEDEESFEEKNEPTCNDKIKELFAMIYRNEDCQKNIELFPLLTEDEIKGVFSTSPGLTAKSFIDSAGFQSLVSKKLGWVVTYTYEAMWKIYETILQLITSLLNKHFIKFPLAKTPLNKVIKDFLNEKRQDSLQILNTFLRSQINYVYFHDPRKIFGDLYEPAHEGRQRRNSMKMPTRDVLIQQLSQACRLYCESVIKMLRDCVPRMIGITYIKEITTHFKVKMRESIKYLVENDPVVLTPIDPFKDYRDDLKNKINLTEEAKNYLMKDISLRGIVWFEDPEMINSHNSQRNIRRRICNTQACARCEEYNKKIHKQNGMMEHNGLPHLKKIMSENNHKKITHGTMIRSSSSISSFEDEIDKAKGSLTTRESKVQSKKSPRKKNRKNSALSKQLSVSPSKILDDVSDSKMSVQSHSPNKSANSKPGSPQIPGPSNLIPPPTSIKPLFGNIEIIQDYSLRDQGLQQKVLTNYEWFKAIGEGSLVQFDEKRILASVQYGIPKHIRSSAWLLLAKVNELKAAHPKGLYEELSTKPSDWEYVIEKDVSRTFGDEPFFKDHEYKAGDKLNRILRAYANYDTELGYTQGMNSIAGLVLMVMSRYEANHSNHSGKHQRLSKNGERNSFWILLYLMKERDYRKCFTDGYPKLMANLEVFEAELERKLPNVVEHLRKWGVTLQAVFMHQFMTVMGQNSPIEFFTRVMDVFLVKGEIVIKIALIKAIELCQEEIMSVKDESLFRFLKHDLLYVACNKCDNNLNLMLVSDEY